MKFHLQAGKTYEAVISLGLFERIASNATIAGKLMDAGFKQVTVTGGGNVRHAEGEWPGPDMMVDLPDEISSVKEIEI